MSLDGNLGIVGVALMTDATTLPNAPTLSLGVKQFADPMPQYVETTEEIATGTRWGRQMTVQGVQSGNKSLVARATLRDLPLLLTGLLGTPDTTTGLITPRANDFGALMPGQPLMVWQKHPVLNSVFPAAQIGGLTINIQTRQTAEVTVTLNTAKVDNPASMPAFPAIASTGLLKFMNFYISIGGTKYAPESGSIEITQPMTAEDGAQGTDPSGQMYILGWSTNGSLTAQMTCVLSEAGAAKYGGSMAGLIAQAIPDPATGERATKAVEAGFTVGDKTIKFNFPAGKVMTQSIPNGLGRLAVTFQVMAEGLGVAPITATVPVP